MVAWNGLQEGLDSGEIARVRLSGKGAVVAAGLLYASCSPEPVDLVQEINAAAPESRRYDVRLDGIDWRPQTRSERTSRAYALEAVAERLRPLENTEARLNRARALLLLGRSQEALQLLESSSPADEPSSHHSLHAAALIAASSDQDDPRLCSRALDVVAGRTSPESTFNRALALECVGLYEDAVQEWSSFESREPTGPWRSEARERRERLESTRSHRESAWISEDTEALEVAELERLAEVYPERLFDLIFDVHLPAWGSAVLSGRATDETIHLERARSGARALGDAWVSGRIEEVESADASKRELAEAYARYGEGREFYRSGKYAEAVGRAQSSRGFARRSDDEMVVLALLLEASGDFVRGDIASVTALLAGREDGPSNLVRGRIGWLRGVAELTLGNVGAGAEPLTMALESFEAAGASASGGVMHSFLGDMWESAGWKQRSWRSRRLAFDRLYGTGYLRYWHLAAVSALIAASEEGHRETASRFARNLRLRAEAGTDPELMASAGVWELLLVPSDQSDYQALVRSTSSSIEKINDPAARQRLQGFLMMARAAHDLATARLDAAAEASTSAATTFETLQANGFLSTALTLGGVVEKKRGNVRGAELQFERAAQLREKQETTVEDPVLAFLMKSGSFDLWHEWIEMLVREGRIEDALQVAGRAYASSSDETALAELMHATRDGDRAIVVFWLRSPTLYRWIIERGRIRFDERRAEGLGEQWTARELSGTALDRVGNALFTSKTGTSLTSSELVIVPGGALYTVPWAAVHVDGAPLIAHHDLLIAPDFGAAARDSERTSSAEVKLVGAPRARYAGESLSYLSAVESEVERIAAQFDRPASIGSFPPPGASSLFHFSGHAISTSPSREPLLLGGSEQWTPGQVWERYAPELSVIAACDTATGEVPGFEGPWSFARGLLERGTKTVVATLWPVVDGRSGPILNDFYARVAAGRPAHVALSEAQRSAMERGLPVEDWAVWSAIGSPVVWHEAETAPPHVAAAKEKGGSL